MFTASCDKTCKMWDLQTNQATAVAEHAAPIKSVAWIQAPNYSCVLTASWDKTLKVALPPHTSHAVKVIPSAVLGCSSTQSGWPAAAPREVLLYGRNVSYGSCRDSSERPHHLHTGGQPLRIQSEHLPPHVL